MNKLPDYLAPSLDLVLVGINPGLRSAAMGHHFAGVGNKFWNLLFESKLVSRRMSYEEDWRLPEHGIGITNFVARPSRSSSDLHREDFVKGRKSLLKKIDRYQPRAAAFVGVTVLREIWPEISSERAPREIRCGRIRERIGSTTLFVVPNPSGRNAHFTYAEMLAEWRRIARFVARSRHA
ncbi:MAG: mismatch-specific DNA-glycosylase [Vicinamibacteria bacterium]